MSQDQVRSWNTPFLAMTASFQIKVKFAYLQAKLTEMEQNVKELKRKSIELGETGDVDAAHAASTEAEALEVRAQSMVT